MASSIQLLRSTNPQERPFAGNLLEGQPAANLHSSEPGLFFKTTDGSIVKFGPAAITLDGSPPNSAPQGSSGNSVGELWLDKSVDPAVLKVYDGTQWVDAGSGSGGGGGGNVSLLRWTKTVLGGETSLSGADDSGIQLSYTPGLEQVFLNGVLLERGTDYVGTNGTSFSNLAPLSADDIVIVLAYSPLSVLAYDAAAITYTYTDINAQQRTVEARLGDYVSVRDFGALGDGSICTDEINAALSTGKAVYFPRGIYLTTGNHSINQRIFGEDKDSVIIRRVSSGPPIIRMSGEGAIEKLTLDGFNSSGTGLEVTNPFFGSYQESYIRDLNITNIGFSTPNKPITFVSNAVNPTVVCPSHGFQTGDLIEINGVIGITSTEPGGAGGIGESLVNGAWRVYVIDSDSFSIDFLDSTGYTAYGSGGTARLASFGLSVQSKTSGSLTVANNKIISNVRFENNDSHLYIDRSFEIAFTNLSMFGQVIGYGIYIGLGVSNISFNGLYMQSCGIRTAAYGIRDLYFRSVNAYLRGDFGTWNRPWFYSLAFNSSETIGAEVAQISFRDLFIQRLDNNTLPLFDINNYDIFFDGVRLVQDGDYSGKGLILDRGTARMSLSNFIIEAIGSWDLFHPNSIGGTGTLAYNVNYTQGTKGSITWSAANEPGIATNRISVRNSNLNQRIKAGGAVRAFLFENILGDVDLTNASVLGTVLRNIYGTVTDPNKAVTFAVNSGSYELLIRPSGVYANNAAALAAGLQEGEVYRTPNGALMVTY